MIGPLLFSSRFYSIGSATRLLRQTVGRATSQNNLTDRENTDGRNQQSTITMCTVRKLCMNKRFIPKGEVIHTEVKPRLGKPLTGILADKTGHTKTQTGGAPGTESMVLPIGPNKSYAPITSHWHAGRGFPSPACRRATS